MAKKNAFTLIELLVVIAIIAILAAVVLVSLGGAQARAKDARVTSAMNQFRTRAVLINDTNGNYTNVACSAVPDTGSCTCTDTEVRTLCTDMVLNDNQTAGDALVIRRSNSAGSNSGYCAYVHLQGTGQYWCVDSALRSKNYAAVPATCAAACDLAGTCACE